MDALTTRVVEGAHSQLVLSSAELRVVAGPDKGLRVPLGSESMLIGSSPQCELVLHDKTVSSRHAEIQVTANGYFIRDLGSTNGILYGPQPIERAPLCHGMRFSLGQSAFLVHATGKQLEIALARSGMFGGLVAHSVKMRALVAALERVALSDATVLIEGETGTGKELVAEAFHDSSLRKVGPFVVFDCAAVNARMAAAELFGHERGAFTGAEVARAGLIEEAHGGTLFIDEIGELPLDLQPLLLGAIERKRSRRIGGTADFSHDVRIVAATNRNLAEEVRAKRFREDLYFRLAVARVKVPPLRERREDLPLLADRFAREAGGQVTPEMIAPLSSYDWPGNVRELKNAVTCMVVQQKGASEVLVEAPRGSARLFDETGALRPWLDVRRSAGLEIEREYLVEVLRLAKGNLSHASTLAGVTRQALAALATKHGLHPRG